jgi:hypothetical protein
MQVDRARYSRAVGALAFLHKLKFQPAAFALRKIPGVTGQQRLPNSVLL